MFLSRSIDAVRRCLETHPARRAQSRRALLSFERMQARMLLSGSPLPGIYPSPPTGLATVIAYNPDPTIEASQLETISNPAVSGVAFQINWSDIEPAGPASEVEPNWSPLQQVFTAADAAGKWVQLLIFPGFFSPSWAIPADSKDFRVQYGPGKGDKMPLPVLWDPTYLGDWKNFNVALEQQFGSNPEFAMIAAAGPTSVSDEFTLPDQNSHVTKEWEHQPYQYTVSKYVGAWQEMFRFYKSEFPNQWISLSYGSDLPIPNRAAVATTRNMVINAAASILNSDHKSQFVFQASSLTGNPSYHTTDIDTIIDDDSIYTTGLQTATSCTGAPKKMGAAGDPSLALALTIVNGMRLNTTSLEHVGYIEVHSADVEAYDLQPILTWAASLFPLESALNVVMSSQEMGELGLTNGPVTVNVTFSEPVTGFSARDLIVENGSVSHFRGEGSDYSFTLSGAGNGHLTTVDIPAGTVQDQNGNENTAAPEFAFTFFREPSYPHPKPPPHPM
jgi:Bacterial Ig-like domain